MAIGRGNYTFGQKMTVFGVTFVTTLLGLGIPLLVIKLAGLAYLTITAIFAGALFAGMIIFHLLFFAKDLNKKMFVMLKTSIFVTVFFVSFVVFTNIIESGAMSIDFIRNLF